MKHKTAVAFESKDFDSDCRRGLRERLNIIAAAEAHVIWKKRLGQCVQSASNEPLDAVLLGQDGVCQLGNLIDGAAFSAFRELPEFMQLREAHQQFHQLALEIVKKLEANDRNAAANLFDSKYSPALCEILKSLSKINKLLAN